jgi:hypothetical protein
MYRIFFSFIFSTLIGNIGLAQDCIACDPNYFKDELLDKLIGKWEINGEIAGDKVQNNFTAQWVLNHQFVELNFTDVKEKPDYIAHVDIGYDCISEQYVVHWIDNFGGRFSKTLGYGVKKNESMIEFRFEYPNAPFINQFIFDSKTNTWHFYLTTKNTHGQWVVFGDEYLKRQ